MARLGKLRVYWVRWKYSRCLYSSGDFGMQKASCKKCKVEFGLGFHFSLRGDLIFAGFDGMVGQKQHI
jgi:hypothetical protein